MEFQDLNGHCNEERGSLSSQESTQRTQEAKSTSDTGKSFILTGKKNYSMNNHSLEQLPKGCSRALITGNFQYLTEQSA